MTDEIPRPAPARPSRRRAYQIAGAGAAVAAVIAAFAVGRGSVHQSATPGASDSCAATVKASESEMAPAAAEQQSGSGLTDQGKAHMRTAMNIIIQNPQCFPVTERGQAQTILDQLDQGAVADAVCAASDQPWWKC